MSNRRVQIEDPRGERHVAVVDIDDSATADDLGDALAQAGFNARPIGVNGTIVGPGNLISEIEVEHGAHVTTGRSTILPPRARPRFHVVVVAGPDSGHVAEIPDVADITIGRSNECDLPLADPLLSSRHLSFRIDGEDSVQVCDLGSTNGSRAENEQIEGQTIVGHGDHVHAGSSVFAVVRLLEHELAVLEPPQQGIRPFARQFRVARPELPKKIQAPKNPVNEDEPRRSTWWRALLPIFTGIGFAAITGRWIFLLVMIVSPIVMAFEALRRKREDAGRDARKREQYRLDLAEFRRNATALRRSERRRRRDDAHCGGLALLLSLARHSRLWERRPQDDDFMAVAVGLASLPSDIAADDPDDALPETEWGTPLQHHLVHTGALAILGSVTRGRAITRNLIVNLAATHSPHDVRIWILTEDTAGLEWNSAQWLPHTFDGDDRSTIASSESDRNRMIRRLRAIAEDRLETKQKSSGAPLPVHLVVIDGAHLVAPSDLGELIGDPHTTGITAITIDERLAPEGAGASLRLGENADESTFTSRHHPQVDDVIVTELQPMVAEPATRRMACLKPATQESVGIDGMFHLVELDPVSNYSGADLRDHWTRHSPHSSAVIGATSDGIMRVDIVTDGPHGLIGGTSGSGKTEFLKTMFVSLCVHNHPDDLAIVVVDFKGGVDHEAIRPLPHVIDVATNLDIDQFKRTIQMLRAESTRRQDLLGSAGASNLVAYREARLRDPSLPPMPRLLVVVDEFGELMSNQDGKDQLKELESITRIGRALGIHLLLVTQNFENSLPPQIDANAGLRISLRVNKPGHSKIVLDSDAASTIPDSRIGRGFARFHGRELIEFQTARVAGRRGGHVTTSDSVTVQMLPFELLGAPRLKRRNEDVPAEETDMWAMIQQITTAAELSGWVRSAVPWPSSLPEHVSMTKLQQTDAEETAIGLADHPDEQRRGLTSITDRDEQIVVIGSPTAPIPETMAAYATVLATRRSADDVHIYGIDLLGRSLLGLEALPHTGAIAVRNNSLSLRIMRHVSQVAAERRMMLAESGASTIWEHVALGNPAPPQIVLLVSGADRMLSTDAPHLALAPEMNALVSDSIGLGIQIILGGLPRIVHNRLGLNIERRLVFALADASDYGPLGVPKQFGGELATDRRAVDLPAGRVTQIARLSPPEGSEGELIRAIGSSLQPATSTPPRKMVDISWPLPLASSGLDSACPPQTILSPLPIGIELNTGEWAWIDAVDDLAFLPITGPPKSGRSTALAVLAQAARDRGWSVLHISHSRRSPLIRHFETGGVTDVELDDLADVVEKIEHGNVLVIADDLHRIDDGDVFKPIISLGDRGLLAVAGPTDLLGGRSGVMRSLPAVTGGVLLAPVSPLDGSAVGLRRLPDEWVAGPRAGRGVLAIAGEAQQIQIPLIDL